MAHLLEHLVFKGTPTIPNVFAGARPPRHALQRHDIFDRTNYFETFSANDENLDWALAMEAERMTQSTFSKADLDTEMTVVRNEFEMGENNPRRVLWKRLQALAFDWHNYGNVTIGARSDVENVDIDRLHAFYRSYYQPDNAVLIVAGRFDPEKTLALIAKYFGAIPKPTRALPTSVHAGAGAGRRAHGRPCAAPDRRSSSASCTARCPARIRTRSRSMRSARS